MNKSWINISLEAVYEASDEIMRIYGTDFSVAQKQDNTPVTIADQRSSEIILSHLRKTNVLIVSEEATIPHYSEREKQDLIWLVDPIDGTKEFIRKTGEFCACIALIQNGQPIFGLIASPVERKILLGGPSIGAYYFDYHEKNYLEKSFQLDPLSLNKKKTVIYSRSGLTAGGKEFLQNLTEKWGDLNEIRKGSALKFVDLSLNIADIYPRKAPTMEWDIAAGQAIYSSIGGEVIDFINFAPLKYNKENLYNPYFIGKNKAIKID
jgi:3'(2'), 5'-bisphosphate nucleotidase